MKALHTVLVVSILATLDLGSAQQFKRTELQCHSVDALRSPV
jgi:hypothetical protein